MTNPVQQRQPQQEQDRRTADAFKRECPLWVSLLAEFIGTSFLTFAAAAPIAVAAITGQLQNLDKVVPPGLTVGALIYAIGTVSGAHFNPAVTLAFALRGSFPWLRLPLYWLAQIAGALAAAGAVLLMFGNVEHVGATIPQTGALTSLALEIVLTTLLCLVILGTSSDHKIVGNNAALAVGGTIALCGMIGGPISGASMNPARSLGPAIIGGALDSAWIYIVGPAIGATIAVLLVNVFHGRPNKDEVAAAQGRRSPDSGSLKERLSG